MGIEVANIVKACHLNLLDGFFEKLLLPLIMVYTFGQLWEENATGIQKTRTSSIDSESRTETAGPMSSTIHPILLAKEEGHDYKQLLMVCDVISRYWFEMSRLVFVESLVGVWSIRCWRWIETNGEATSCEPHM